MTVDEAWMKLRTRLEELVGVSGAEILMDRPHGGWGDLVTNHTLDLRFATSEERFDRKLDALEARIDRRFAGVDGKFADLESRMDLRFAAIDASFAEVHHRFDNFGLQLLAQVDQRMRAQAWMSISTIVAVGAVIVAAIRL
jgi:hypothetical protein